LNGIGFNEGQCFVLGSWFFVKLNTRHYAPGTVPLFLCDTPDLL